MNKKMLLPSAVKNNDMSRLASYANTSYIHLMNRHYYLFIFMRKLN